jgi:hypothetical protein
LKTRANTAPETFSTRIWFVVLREKLMIMTNNWLMSFRLTSLRHHTRAAAAVTAAAAEAADTEQTAGARASSRLHTLPFGESTQLAAAADPRPLAE